MKVLRLYVFVIILLALVGQCYARHKNTTSGNPLFPGWYADPEARIYDNWRWIFAICFGRRHMSVTSFF